MHPASLIQRGLVAALLCACAGATPVHAAGVVISQIYGAGGNGGAAFDSDYVELFNAGTQPAGLAGWSLQYASATGTGTFAANGAVGLPPLVLQPGQYLLVRLASGGAAGAPLPAADASAVLNLAAGAGKVVLLNSAGGLACNGGSVPCTPAQLAQVVDLVGFGNASFFESAPAPAASAGAALLRQGGGCVDTQNNAADFATGTPAPRNGSAPLQPCSGATRQPADRRELSGDRGAGGHGRQRHAERERSGQHRRRRASRRGGAGGHRARAVQPGDGRRRHGDRAAARRAVGRRRRLRGAGALRQRRRAERDLQRAGQASATPRRHASSRSRGAARPARWPAAPSRRRGS
jgi:hypothetical protein